LSHRLQFAPHRFFSSGLQSYYDVSDFARQVAAGEHELFREGSELDLFGYSAGATLSQMLLMGNPEGRFSRSRGFLFCGGAVMDQVDPVSKMIMDSEAHRELSSFLQRLAEGSEAVRECGIPEEIEDRPEVALFRSLLLVDRLRELRERVVSALRSRLRIVTMAKDRVFSTEGMRRSWRSRDGAPVLDVQELDPPYDYSHEQPFSLRSSQQAAVDRCFRELLEAAAGQLTPG
jgi:pimeloyl-ACP methyl ester carboxylesterase